MVIGFIGKLLIVYGILIVLSSLALFKFYASVFDSYKITQGIIWLKLVGGLGTRSGL